MSATPKAKKTRKRYSSDEKKEIIAFVEKHDSENGRGGKSAAVTKYGISPISLSAWIKSAGGPVSSGNKRGRKPGSKNVAKEVKVAAVKGGSFTVKLKELSALASQIDKAEADLSKLKAKFESLKGAL
jgi:transposase-like protein